jgi:hypothetical protein
MLYYNKERELYSFPMRSAYLVEGSDRHGPIYALREVVDDGRLGDGVNAGELSRRVEEVVLQRGGTYCIRLCFHGAIADA